MQYNPQILHVKYNCGDTIEIEIPTNVIKIHQQGIFSNHGGKNIKQKYLHFLLVITILMPTVIMTTPLLLLVLFTMCFACFRLKSQYIDKKSPSKMIPFMQIYLQLKFFKNSHSYSFSLEANSSTLLCGVLFFFILPHLYKSLFEVFIYKTSSKFPLLLLKPTATASQHSTSLGDAENAYMVCFHRSLIEGLRKGGIWKGRDFQED